MWLCSNAECLSLMSNKSCDCAYVLIISVLNQPTQLINLINFRHRTSCNMPIKLKENDYRKVEGRWLERKNLPRQFITLGI